jgi:hypothetical protein
LGSTEQKRDKELKGIMKVSLKVQRYLMNLQMFFLFEGLRWSKLGHGDFSQWGNNRNQLMQLKYL